MIASPSSRHARSAPALALATALSAFSTLTVVDAVLAAEPGRPDAERLHAEPGATGPGATGPGATGPGATGSGSAVPNDADGRARVLPAITVTGGRAAPLEQPTATGTRLAMTPLETPASVDVLTRADLEARGDADIIAALTRSTGITTLGHPGNSGSALSARGFADSTSVMMLYDGLRQYGNVSPSFPYSTWAIDRIEVLRGPASVIHGDGAIGAVVNIVPKKPGRGPIENEVQAGIGTRGERGLAFGSGGAINERLSYRLDASTDRSDGWVDRGRHSNQALSFALQFDPTPDLRFTASHARGHQKPMAYYGLPLIDGRAIEALRRSNYDVADGRIDYRDAWSELRAEWSPNARLKLRSRLYHVRSDRYWRNVESVEWNDQSGLLDRFDATEIAHRQRQTGNTTDLVFSHALFGRENQIAVGFDLNEASFRHSNNTHTGTVASVDPWQPEPGLYESPIPFIPRYRTRARQQALFAEDRLQLSTRWSLVAGLRRDHLKLDRDDLVAGQQAYERSYANTGWRLGAVYQWQPERSVYAQVARAADPVAALMFLSPANSDFDLSYGRQIEIGLKQVLPQGGGEFTISAYHIVKNNLLTRDSTNPALRVQVGERSSRGLEATALVVPLPTVRVQANVALLRARFDDFSEAVGGVAVSRNGKVPPDVPERVANLWADWDLQPAWTLGGGLRYVGRRYADNANTLAMPSYTTVDLALRWRATRATTLALRGFNVLDRFYFNTAYYSGTQWLVGEGRRVELVVNHRF